MLITPLPYGRMGNRLMLAAHFLAHVENHGGRYWHLAFFPYGRYFEGTRGKPFLRYTSSRGPRVEGAAKRRWPVSFWFELFGLDRGGGDVHMDEEPFLARERRSRVLLCGAWAFRDRAATRECAAAIRRFFRPVSKWREPAEACVAAAREGADHLVAVHMRLTDYAKFNGGAWFYAPADYRRWMEQTAALLPGRTRFLLFSDAMPPAESFAGLDGLPGPEHPVSAMHAMSLCDYILGPPSTFSGWASFMGRVPRLQLKSRDQMVRLEDFVESGA